MVWETIDITTEAGETVRAQAPVIISASRATDIPAFYADWFFDRLEKGYSVWTNPFNGVKSYISYARTRLIVFWSKNPRPLLPHLGKLREKGIRCYLHYTLNDYEAEGLERGVPPLDERIETFLRFSELLGKELVIWRFDPLVLTERTGVEELLRKAEQIGDRLRRAYRETGFQLRGHPRPTAMWRAGCGGMPSPAVSSTNGKCSAWQPDWRN